MYQWINAAKLGNEQDASMVELIPLDRLLTETDGPFTKTDERPLQAARRGLVDRSASSALWRANISVGHSDPWRLANSSCFNWRPEE